MNRLVLLLLLFLAAPAGAEIYTWKNAAGTSFYTNSLDEIPARYRKRAKVLDVASGKTFPIGAAPAPQATPGGASVPAAAAAPVPVPAAPATAAPAPTDAASAAPPAPAAAVTAPAAPAPVVSAPRVPGETRAQRRARMRSRSNED